jgi:hypothetical protein
VPVLTCSPTYGLSPMPGCLDVSMSHTPRTFSELAHPPAGLLNAAPFVRRFFLSWRSRHGASCIMLPSHRSVKRTWYTIKLSDTLHHRPGEPNLSDTEQRHALMHRRRSYVMASSYLLRQQTFQRDRGYGRRSLATLEKRKSPCLNHVRVMHDSDAAVRPTTQAKQIFSHRLCTKLLCDFSSSSH